MTESFIQIPALCGLGLSLKLDGFRVIYSLIACLMWSCTTVFSLEYMGHHGNKKRYYAFTGLTFLGTVGVFLSGDLYTTFIFFEIMSIASYVWVAQEETEDALRAAQTYLAVGVTGGLSMLMGLFIFYVKLGTLDIDALPNAAMACPDKAAIFAAGLFMLVGFGAKAGAMPLHIWLPKAHPVAPAPASALLSGILTKAGVYGIIILSSGVFFKNGYWGVLILIIGLCTMVWGAVLGVLSINLKRTLACSSLSQIGFILTGLGMLVLDGGEAIAARGIFLHMVNHSMFKLLLFMIAGVVFMNLEQLDLNEIRGFGREKTLLKVLYLVGGLGISGVPLLSGYVSKTLLHESIVEYYEHLEESGGVPFLLGVGDFRVIEWIFLISGGLTLCYIAKLFICIFMEENNNAHKQAAYDGSGEAYMSLKSKIALGIPAICIIAMGACPYMTMDRLASMAEPFFRVEGHFHGVNYFSPANLKGAGISLMIGAILYLTVVRRLLMRKDERGNRIYVDIIPRWFDLENSFYRPLVLKILPFIGGLGARVLDSIVDSLVVFLRKTIYCDSRIIREKEEGNFFTVLFGFAADGLIYAARCIGYSFYGRFIGKKKPQMEGKYRHRLALFDIKVSEYGSVLSRSMSFGLFLFCMGFVIIVVYLMARLLLKF